LRVGEKSPRSLRARDPGGIFLQLLFKRLFKMRKFLLLILSCFFITAYADALKDLSALLAIAHSASATFTQTITDGDGQILQSSTGNMKLVKPGYFWWEIQKPNQQLIIIKNRTIYFYQADLEQLTIRPFNLNETQTPATLLLNANMDILNSQYITHKETDRDLLIFSLIPKADNQLLKSIMISFEGDKLVELELADHLDHLTKIIFKNFKLDPSISASQFTFNIPKGTDVIHE